MCFKPCYFTSSQRRLYLTCLSSKPKIEVASLNTEMFKARLEPGSNIVFKARARLDSNFERLSTPKCHTSKQAY